MVALLKPTTTMDASPFEVPPGSARVGSTSGRPQASPFRPLGRSTGLAERPQAAAGLGSTAPAQRSHLQLVDTPPRRLRARGVPVAGTAAAVAVVFGLLLAVRVSQDPPPSGGWAELSGSRAPAQAFAGPGDQIRVARSGDTFWALARELAPDQDPRPVVDLLVAANGGRSALDAGQEIVIPAELLGG